MVSLNILDHFSALEDPRQSAKVLYPLEEILLRLLCATLAGADDFVEMAEWGRAKLAFLKRFLPFERGVPAHDTLNDVMNALPSALFVECFADWVACLRDDDADIVSIDGKTSRRAHACNGKSLHLVSAWASRQRLVLGQEACTDKKNEITAIPRLLNRLARRVIKLDQRKSAHARKTKMLQHRHDSTQTPDAVELKGALVTIDAMGCQHGIANKIRDASADYLLALKSNQKHLHEEVSMFFSAAKGLDTHRTTDGDHGRIETRTVSVCHQVDWLVSNRKSPDEPKFSGLSTIAMVVAEVERDGNITTSRRFYICSVALSARQIAAAIRAYWGGEYPKVCVLGLAHAVETDHLLTRSGYRIAN